MPRFNPGSFTVATESTEGTGDKWKELFTRGLLRHQFFLLITLDKNIIFFPHHDFYLKLPTSFPQKSED